MKALEEIRKDVFESVHKGDDLKYDKKAFYAASGAKHLQIVCGGNTLDMFSSILSTGYRIDEDIPVTTIDFNAISADELKKSIKDNFDSLAQIEKDWNALVREATIADKVKDLGKMSIEAILKNELDGTAISYHIEELCDASGEKTKVHLYDNKFDMYISMPPKTPELPVIIKNVSDTVSKAFKSEEISLPEETMKFVSNRLRDEQRVLCWYDRNRNGKSEYMDQSICDEVVAAGRKMDFQISSNTQEELFSSITKAGINAEMIVSPYCHTKQDIRISCGEFVILITRGKVPGMLVACSPFFSVDYHTTCNICVSNRPLDQIVQWLKEACDKLAPIANKIIPTYNVLQKRKLEMSKARELVKGISTIPGVSGEFNKYGYCNCSISVEGVGSFELKNIDIGKTEPIKTANAVVDIVKMMSDLKTKITFTE